ncbi:MAE_28990/MAE_18760 family HEPN-like nuclease [Tissierella praeacuta]|uniref:MAE_28990/MAE_18760 family HEPN-like nuclease n=1 Tax=Tissierella praeacuta TaxID=43131 RepID=UPI003DA4ED65
MTTFEDYESRKKELKYFYYTLSNFDSYSLSNAFPLDFVNYAEYDFMDFLKILKSSYILMLYNFIESSVTIFITSIYDTIRDRELAYSDASEELQTLWVESLLSDSFDQHASYNTFKNKAIDVIGNVLSDNTVSFTIDKIPKMSGNINFRIIKNICKTHGIELQSSSRAQDDNGEYSINTIKDDRNALAHGRKSFIECSRNYSVNELSNFTIEIIKLLDDLSESISHYIESEQYLKNPLQSSANALS